MVFEAINFQRFRSQFTYVVFFANEWRAKRSAILSVKYSVFASISSEILFEKLVLVRSYRTAPLLFLRGSLF